MVNKEPRAMTKQEVTGRETYFAVADR